MTTPKPTDLIHRLDLVKRQHEAAPTPLETACRETLEAFLFFDSRLADPLVAAQLAGIALDNIMEEE